MNLVDPSGFAPGMVSPSSGGGGGGSGSAQQVAAQYGKEWEQLMRDGIVVTGFWGDTAADQSGYGAAQQRYQEQQQAQNSEGNGYQGMGVSYSPPVQPGGFCGPGGDLQAPAMQNPSTTPAPSNIPGVVPQSTSNGTASPASAATPSLPTLRALGVTQECQAGLCVPALYGENIRALGQMQVADTSETWKTGFFIVTAMVPVPELGLLAAAKGAGGLLQAGLQPFKNTALTVAGRALTKHPELVGLTKATLTQSLRSPEAINAAAESALRGILESGTPTVRELGRFGMTLEIRGANGFGARFGQATGEFIGFITP